MRSLKYYHCIQSKPLDIMHGMLSFSHQDSSPKTLSQKLKFPYLSTFFTAEYEIFSNNFIVYKMILPLSHTILKEFF